MRERGSILESLHMNRVAESTKKLDVGEVEKDIKGCERNIEGYKKSKTVKNGIFSFLQLCQQLDKKYKEYKLGLYDYYSKEAEGYDDHSVYVTRVICDWLEAIISDLTVIKRKLQGITESYSTINEASLGRLLQHIEKGEPMVFVSASRDCYTAKENNIRYAQLQNIVKHAHFGYNKVLGGYVEATGDVTEKSLVIYGTAEREQELKDLAIGIGKKFNQESVLFVYSDGNAVYIYTSENAQKNPIGYEDFVGRGITQKGIEKFFTKIGHRKFLIKSISESYEAVFTSLPNRIMCDEWQKMYKKYGADIVEMWDKFHPLTPPTKK